MSENTQNDNNTPPASSENPAITVQMPPLTTTNIRGDKNITDTTSQKNTNTKQGSKD